MELQAAHCPPSSRWRVDRPLSDRPPPSLLQLRQVGAACRWRGVDVQEGISSWEFQLRVARSLNATLPRAEWEATVERSFAAVEAALPGFRMDRWVEQAAVV